MKMTFRWYGRESDPIPLKYVKQIPGMSGLMGLLDKPAGVDWPEEEVKALVEAACGLLDAYSAIVGPGNPWGDSLRAALAASSPADPVTNAGCCQALLKERDDLRAKQDAAAAGLETIIACSTCGPSRATVRATIAKIKGADHE